MNKKLEPATTKRILPNPIEAIKFRMEQYGHNLTTTSHLTSIATPHLCEVLKNKRKLNLDMVRKLYIYGVPLEVLIQKY